MTRPVESAVVYVDLAGNEAAAQVTIWDDHATGVNSATGKAVVLTLRNGRWEQT